MSRDFVVSLEDRFSFELWTVGSPGLDHCSEAARPRMAVGEMLRGLADIGVYGCCW